MTAAVATLGAAVLLLALLVAGLLRSHAEILRALHELGAGLELDKTGPVPVTIDGIAKPRRPGAINIPSVLRGETLDGDVVALSLTGPDTLIAFLSSGCSTCQEFWKAFAGLVPDVPGGARLVVVSRQDDESPSALREREPTHVPLLLSDEMWDAFEVPGSPYFVYVDGRGQVVGEGSGASWKQVVELMSQSRADAAPARGNSRHRQSRDEQTLRAAGIDIDHPSLHGGSE